MVFIIVKIVSNLTILKDWFGCKYNDTNNLLELYNDFSSGAIDKVAPIAQWARIGASAGRSKTDFDPVCFYCGRENNLQTPEEKYPVCDMCLSGKKGAAWQEKKRQNELFESCLFSKANYWATT